MNKQISLAIDTHEQTTARVSLEIDGTVVERISDSRILKSQMVLPLLEELLNTRHLSLRDLTDIRVHTGPGSFTGIRVGISIANVLSTLLHIPVNGKDTLAEAEYNS